MGDVKRHVFRDEFGHLAFGPFEQFFFQIFQGQMGQGKTGVGIKAFHHKNHLDGRFELAGDHDGGLQNPV